MSRLATEIQRLESELAEKSTDKLLRIIAELISENAALLSACKAQLNAHTPFMIRQASADARSAIQKAEGRAQ